MSAHFEIYRTNVGTYRWRFKKPNGQIELTSRHYARKANALASVSAVRRIVRTARIKDLTE